MEKRSFAPMRRIRQQMEEEAAWALLRAGEYCVLALAGEYPYAVPLNYALEGRKMYFHCAREGHKIEAMRRDARVSACVVGRHEVAPQEYTSHFESVIVFGRARELADEAERRHAIELICDKYCEGKMDPKYDVTPLPARLNLVEIEIEHITGKVCKEWM